MDAAHRLDALRTEGDAALRSAEDRLDAPIPHLDWTVGGVVAHLGGVHRRFTTVLRDRPDVWPGRETVTAPGSGLIDWARTGLAGLVTAVGAVDLDDEFTTWAGACDGHWVLRRVANETAVHRWDIEAASGPPAAFAPDLAVDIVDEFLRVIVPGRDLLADRDREPRVGATLHLHATDTDPGSGEWFLTVTGAGLEVEDRHDKGDVALRGPASDLALWVSGRVPASRLDAFGDQAVAAWWSEIVRFD